jgi:site-specific recombinase XerC
MLREKVKDKSYRAYPMGQRAGEYLRWKRGRLTPASYRDYESCLDKLAREHPDLEIEEFEPPVGVTRVEEFLDRMWGDAAPRTYNKNLSILKDFFQWAVLKGLLHGDPSLPIVPHKKRDVHREIFRDDDTRRIVADGPDPDYIRRDRIALRLLVQYGLRKGALQHIQFRHFDQSRRRLTIFTKGQKIREVPIPDPALWDDLAKLMFELGAEPHHYLMCRRKAVFHGYHRDGSTRMDVTHFRDKPMGVHGLHDWWYGCLTRAGLVAEGTTRGEKMHKARHTAGQRVLDKTGNLKAAQRLLGHSSIQTTADVYTDWDIDQLEQTMREVLDA